MCSGAGQERRRRTDEELSSVDSMAGSQLNNAM